MGRGKDATKKHNKAQAKKYKEKVLQKKRDTHAADAQTSEHNPQNNQAGRDAHAAAAQTSEHNPQNSQKISSGAHDTPDETMSVCGVKLQSWSILSSGLDQLNVQILEGVVDALRTNSDGTM